MPSKIHIGTSGWHYKHWQGPFYPQDLKPEEFLEFYTGHMPTVEINNTFYQLPDESTLALWRDTVPENFVFAVKASRYLTHLKKLKDPAQPATNFLESITPLGDKLGPVLFQLPPRWHFNEDRLVQFLDTLPSKYRYSFEFRDSSWFNPKTYTALKRHNAAFCIYHLNGRVSPKEITANFVYARLHGPEAPYQGDYDSQTLQGWAGAFSSWADQGKEIFCYFDNDQAGYAVKNALELQAMLTD